MIYHALYCSKIVTNDSHHLPNVLSSFSVSKHWPYKVSTNQHEIVQNVIIGRCNWCLLTSASPSLTKFSSEERRLLTSSHSNRFYKKTTCSQDLQMENGLLFMCWEFPLDEFLDKITRGWSRDAIINNF